MMALEDDAYTRSLRAWGERLSGARAIAVVSAHWERELPIRVTASPRPGLIYDFYGFPPELYELEYGPKGDAALAARIAKTLAATGATVERDGERGLDHGCWVPLRHLVPDAHIPVLQVSIPRPSGPADMVRLGQLLAPFRDEGVAVIGSGNIVHNLRLVHPKKDAPADGWASQFDGWFRERLVTMDVAGALRYRQDAPHASLAVPTTEHFDPALAVLGTAQPQERIEHVFEGIYNRNVSMRCFALVPPLA